MYLRGDFLDKTPVIQALRQLRTSGFPAGDIDVFSDEPVEFPRDALHRSSHMSLSVVIGAITVCLLVIGFVYFTQHNYPLVTGGMPLFSFWATGVIFYELTMLGAILHPLIPLLPSAMILPPPLGASCTDDILTSPSPRAPVRRSSGTCPSALGYSW